MALSLSSPEFTDGGAIPDRFTCNGQNQSPELRWDGAPDGTQSYALVMHDPDAPRGDFTHWVLYDVPGEIQHLAENSASDSVGRSGANSFGHDGYGGPCPPQGDGPHRYVFDLYALDRPSLSLPSGASRADVERALRGHTLGQAHLTGRFERKR